MVLSIDEILAFYLGGSADDADVMRACVERWFNVDRKLDELVESQYGQAIDAALGGAFDHWQESAEGALALILLLDQLPRNAYRGSSKAFAGDERACAAALLAHDLSYPESVPLFARVFFMMPFEHAEDLGLQRRYVAGCEAIHAQAPRPFLTLTADIVETGKQHCAVISRFGRFPHRNALLGRQSTDKEHVWLADNRHAWGQGAADLEAE